ncbi:MAG: hypothetical protein HQM10_24900 [Candidatus Riflebacteria bacterium]|nr:hypothetical protein [Candidatus Riflebacteria bacterium]
MTDRRLFRIARSLHQRQLDLIIGLEKVHDPHNLAAILRSADATGVGKVVWAPNNENPLPPNPEVSKSSEKWVELIQTTNFINTMKSYKDQGFNIAATHLGNTSVDFRTPDWSKPWVVILGNERIGCSKEILEICDLNIQLPMMGLVQSLNVSVATAVILYEIQRQRQNKGMYSRVLPPGTVKSLFDYWKLAEEGIKLEDVLQPPPFEMEVPDSEHLDGRTAFLERRRLEKEAKLKKAAEHVEEIR